MQLPHSHLFFSGCACQTKPGLQAVSCKLSWLSLEVKYPKRPLQIPQFLLGNWSCSVYFVAAWFPNSNKKKGSGPKKHYIYILGYKMTDSLRSCGFPPQRILFSLNKTSFFTKVFFRMVGGNESIYSPNPLYHKCESTTGMHSLSYEMRKSHHSTFGRQGCKWGGGVIWLATPQNNIGINCWTPRLQFFKLSALQICVSYRPAVDRSRILFNSVSEQKWRNASEIQE